jgi:hypothetical protein
MTASHVNIAPRGLRPPTFPYHSELYSFLLKPILVLNCLRILVRPLLVISPFRAFMANAILTVPRVCLGCHPKTLTGGSFRLRLLASTYSTQKIRLYARYFPAHVLVEQHSYLCCRPPYSHTGELVLAGAYLPCLPTALFADTLGRMVLRFSTELIWA